MNNDFVRLAAVFYGVMVLAAAAWNGLRDRELFALGPVPLGLILGSATAAATVCAGLAVYRLVPAMRSVAQELAPRLVEGASTGELVLLSVFSGVGEEALFRGAMQPEFGFVATSLIFGLVHVGPDRRYLAWTLWAIFAGFLFGALYEATGGLLAPTVAHVLHNATVLLLWRRSRARRTTRSSAQENV